MDLKFQLHNHGFEVHERACPAELLDQFRTEFSDGLQEHGELLENSRLVSEAASIGFLKQLAARVLGTDCVAKSATLRNKQDTAEPWHQITSAKLIVRLSLDDCTFLDGGLKLCPSSYKHGVLTAQEIRGHSMRPFSSPEMKAGDVLLMHPLTIHASAANTTGRPRRVVEILYTTPDPL